MKNNSIPLAERLRPTTLDDYIGQKHIIGENAVLRRAIESGRVPSMIFWGPPGVGKTTLAFIISKQVQRQFFQLSAVSSGVKEVREVIDRARMAPEAPSCLSTKSTVLASRSKTRFLVRWNGDWSRSSARPPRTRALRSSRLYCHVVRCMC